MFRRSNKSQHIAPAPPTFQQILEDLETFEVERAEHEPLRCLDATDDVSVAASANQHSTTDENVTNAPAATPVADAEAQESSERLALWWRTFTTFRHDVNELHRYRRQLQVYEADLIDTRDGIDTELQGLRRRVEDALNRCSSS